MKEVWKDVVGYEGLYKVSNRGRVKSVCRKWRTTEKILCPSIHKGYVYVHLSKDGKDYTRFVHKLVLEAFVGPCPIDMEARHFPDRDGTNCWLNNLSWSTHKDNCHDQVAHGTLRKGSRNGKSKLTEDSVLSIVRKYESGDFTQEELGNDFGVTTRAIGCILQGITWGHLTGLKHLTKTGD